MQILGISDEIFFWILNGIYSIVARVYDILMKLVVDQGSMDMSRFDELASIMYVLAGVFILFKVALGLVQMLINPDLINDKQAGAGKMITRIIVSLVMLLVFVPNGLIFGDNGLFKRVERALLDQRDGLVKRIMELDGPKEIADNNNGFLIENVEAKDYYTCYYYQIDEYQTGIGGISNRSITKFYRIDFSKNKKTDGRTFQKIINSDDWYFYSLNSNYRVGGENGYKDTSGNNLKYTKLDDLGVIDKNENNSEREKYNYGKNSSFATCPKAIIPSGVQTGFIKNSFTNYAMKANVDYGKSVGPNYPNQFYPGGLYGGTTNLKDLFEHANKVMKAHDAVLGVKYGTNSADIETPEQREASSKEYLKGVEDDAIVFAQGTASSLQECVEDKQKDCADAQQRMFKYSSGNDDIIQLSSDKDLDMGFIVSLIAGLGLIVYLLFLCIEVLIRRFKLFFLEVLAPIPIVSYIDPKDKIFGRWIKMYFSIYADLFIKLISISIAINLLETVFDEFWTSGGLQIGGLNSALVKFFYIVAILIFAKVLPTMISKIFGLDSMGGSFKDIMGMAKGAAGFATGGAIGGAIGGITGAIYGAQGRNGIGKILGGVSGALGGALRGVASGAGSGWKGKVMGGAQSVSAKNALKAQQRADGLNFLDRMVIAGYNNAGISPVGKYADQMKLADEVANKRGTLDKWAKDELVKKGAMFNSGNVNNGQAILSKDKTREVTYADEDINMKNEYKRQSIMNGLTSEQWSEMDPEKRKAEFGSLVGGYKSLAEAQVFMDDRVAALEDYGKSIRINEALRNDDAEAIKNVNALKSSISNARNGGVQIDQIPDGANFDSKTLKNAKDQANQAYNRIGDQNEKAITRQKYIKGSGNK